MKKLLLTLFALGTLFLTGCEVVGAIVMLPYLMVASGTKRRPSAREDGGVSGVSSSCGARGGFLLRHDEDLREPLVRRQGSQVS